MTDVFMNCRRIPEEQVLWLLQDQPWKYADATRVVLHGSIFFFLSSDPPKTTPLSPFPLICGSSLLRLKTD